MKKTLLLFFLSTFWLVTWGQTTIVSWSFASSTAAADGGLAANIGVLISRTATGVIAYPNGCGSGCTVPNPPYITCDGWQGTSPQPYYQTAAFVTTGYQSLTIAFQSRSSNTGPADFQLQYKVGAGAFTDVPSGAYSNINNFVTQTFTLPAAVDDQAAVQVRWLKVGNVAVTGGTVQSGGTSGLDEIIINGSATAPVALLTFNALKDKDRSVLLSWSTANEVNNDHFSIERSSSTESLFVEIGKKPGAGTSHELQRYDFKDVHPAIGKNYYRLRQVDLDGTSEYSPVVMVRNDGANELSISPVPVVHQLQVQFGEINEEALNWQVLDYTGRVLFFGTTSEEIAAFELNVSDLASGAYVLRVVSGEKTWVKPFQKK